MFNRLLLLLILLAALGHGPVAQAHDSRPAYLEINETAPGRYEVLWRTPINAGMRLPVLLKFPDDTPNITAPSLKEFSGLLLERRWIDAGKSGLAGKRIEFVGLQATITDVLVRAQALDGTHTTTLVRPSQPWVEIAASQGIAGIAAACLMHGFEHIMFGTDHLLFVLGLMLMVRDLWMLLKTITAFTLAHSLTLAAATLGYVHVPSPPPGGRNCAFHHVRRRRGAALLAKGDEPHAAPALACRLRVRARAWARIRQRACEPWVAVGGHSRRLVVFQYRRRGRPTFLCSGHAAAGALLRSAQYPLAAAGAHGPGLCRRLGGRFLDDRPDRRHGRGIGMTSSIAICCST